MKNICLIFIVDFVSCKPPFEKNANIKSKELEQLEVSIDSLFNAKIGANESGAAVLVSYDGENDYWKRLWFARFGKLATNYWQHQYENGLGKQTIYRFDNFKSCRYWSNLVE